MKDGKEMAMMEAMIGKRQSLQVLINQLGIIKGEGAVKYKAEGEDAPQRYNT